MGQDQSGGQKSNRSADASPAGEIVVVKSGKYKTKDQQINKDPDLLKLEKIPKFHPLMKSSLNIQSMTDFDSMNKIDVRPAQQICARYQTHLKLCAEAVTFDQDAITQRIKELDIHSASVLRHVSQRYKKLQCEMNVIETVNEIKKNINRVEMTLQQIMPLMDELNKKLSEDHRMEPFLND